MKSHWQLETSYCETIYTVEIVQGYKTGLSQHDCLQSCLLNIYQHTIGWSIAVLEKI
jgi:hypothetical protein